MDLEERFGITLPDKECSRVRTVADLAALVIARHPRSAAACPTAHRFFELRAAITRITGVGRARVRPATPLSELFPPTERRRWQTLCREDPRLPPLVVSPRADRALLALSVALFGATLACGAWLFASMSAVLAAPLTLAAILLAVFCRGRGDLRALDALPAPFREHRRHRPGHRADSPARLQPRREAHCSATHPRRSPPDHRREVGDPPRPREARLRPRPRSRDGVGRALGPCDPSPAPPHKTRLPQG